MEVAYHRGLADAFRMAASEALKYDARGLPAGALVPLLDEKARKATALERDAADRLP